MYVTEAAGAPFSVATKTTGEQLIQPMAPLARLDQLRTFSGFFAILFVVKLLVSIAAVGKNG
jgi:hypothetical protein